MASNFKVFIQISCLFCLVAACTHEPFEAINPEPEIDDNYPPEIAKIILTKCATAGCHNKASYSVSGGGLLMDSWEHLFDGGNTGAAVIPFSPENSSLMYFTNSFADLGPIPEDDMKMPLNNTSLSREEYLTLRNWIIQGAPDKNGNIPFASNAETRQKIYVSHQGCDYITVIDAEKNVVMRCVPIGKVTTIESAYSLKIAPDGNAFISFWAGQHLLKMDTKTDSLVDDIDLGNANSNVIHIAPSSNELLVSNLYSNSMLLVNTINKSITYDYRNNFSSPHGIASNKSFDTFFLTQQYGNTVCKISSNGTVKKISIDGKPLSTSNTGPNPYNIVMSPDYSKYFLSCQGSGEIRVMDAYADTLIKVIQIGATPQEMVISKKMPYLFVTCMDDEATIPLYKGSVYIIDYNTHTIVKKINDRYYMPHALSVDDVHKKLFVFSRNIDPDGPIPHHNSATCDGRNGYYSVYDLDKMQPLNNKRYEVTIDPFAADVRFK